MLLCVFASLGVLFLSWLGWPNSIIQVTTVSGSREELVEVASNPLAGFIRETKETNVDDFEVDVNHGWVAREDRKLLPRVRIAKDRKTRRPTPAPSPYAVSAQTAPASVAETAYAVFWEEFIGDMDLPDEPTVRAIITEWHRFNLELIFAQREGDIAFHELARSVLSVEDLQTRLTPHLTASQLVDVVANFEAFSDYIAGEYAYRRASAWLQGGYRGAPISLTPAHSPPVGNSHSAEPAIDTIRGFLYSQ